MAGQPWTTRPTAEAVRSAVRLTLTHQRLQDEQRVRLGQLHEARARLVAATDLERDLLREELRTAVPRPSRPRGHVGAASTGAGNGDDTVAEALGIAMRTARRRRGRRSPR